MKDFGRFFNVHLFIKLTLSDFLTDCSQGIRELSEGCGPTRGLPAMVSGGGQEETACVVLLCRGLP